MWLAENFPLNLWENLSPNFCRCVWKSQRLEVGRWGVAVFTGSRREKRGLRGSVSAAFSEGCWESPSHQMVACSDRWRSLNVLLSISHISLVGKEDGELGRSASVSRSPPFCKNGGKQFRRMVNVGLEIMCFGSLSQFYNFFFFNSVS